MALSHFESIAEHLDEAKAEKDHESLLNYLRLRGLPYVCVCVRGEGSGWGVRMKMMCGGMG